MKTKNYYFTLVNFNRTLKVAKIRYIDSPLQSKKIKNS